MNKKILILHLSDIHIYTSSDVVLGRAKSIACATFQHLPGIHTLAIVISGDVAFSGTSAQYELAITFLEEIKNEIRIENSLINIEIFVCPGNHDCDFQLHDETRDAVLDRIRASDGGSISESLIKTASCVEEEFFKFRDKISIHKWSYESSLVWQTTINIGEYFVGFRSLNIAWMSELREKQGTLIYPPSEVKPFEFDANTGLSVTILHHPFNWFGQTTYRPFQAVVRRESHLIFTGHEHFQNVVEVNDIRDSSSVLIEGGVLADKSTPNLSTFNMVTVDLASKEYRTELFCWDGENYLSQAGGDEWGSLKSLPTKGRSTYELQSEFSKSLADPGANFSHSAKRDLEIDDIFVWPELRFVDDPAPIKKQISGEYFEHLENISVGVLLRGDEKTGKSTLLRQYFKSYYDRGFLPLYFRASWFNKSHCSEPLKAMKYAFDRQYLKQGRDTWFQESKNQRVLLLDDLDGCSLSPENLSECLQGIFKYFSGVIVTARDGAAALDMLAIERVEALHDFQHYEIKEFGHKKRFELVCKWAEIGGETADAASWCQTIDKWEKDLTAAVGRQFVPAVPIYLLTLLQSIESGKTADLQNSAFGHYYQYLVTSSLQNVGIEREQWNEVMNYCANLAWNFYSSNWKQISEKKFEEFNSEFSKEFTPVSFERRKKNLNAANILTKIDGDWEFKYPYLYYFFLGQYISDRIHEVEVEKIIKQLCKDLHLRDNANVLLFASHHTKSPVIYQGIVEALKKCFSEELVFDFQRDAQLLNKLVDSAPNLIYKEDSTLHSRAGIREAQDQAEERAIDEDSVESVTETQAAITRLFRGMEILGQFLKNHYGTTKNPVKDDLIDELLKSALRGLYGATAMLRENTEVLAEHIERVLVEKRPELPPEVVKNKSKRIVFDIIGMFTFAFVQKAGSSVGSTYLKDNLSSVVEVNGSLAYELVEMSYRLDLPEPIPFARIKKINKSIDGNVFAKALLSSMALRHLHMFKVSYQDKQRICDEFGITLERQMAIDYDRRMRHK
ncbi:hypothetical protein FMZ60_11430 [Alcaligenaceae bacterium SJ-26]|nr:hypothetical protein FMZ60_11430 [Alcaligenaceae bacterium SJ-26]